MNDAITFTLDRRFLEHPTAHHVRKMRAAVWLYLVLLSRLPADADTIEVVPHDLARRMGLPEGTIRSWLGHLRRGRYIDTRRLNGGIEVRVKRRVQPTAVAASPPEPEAPDRFFTVAKLARSLGGSADDVALGAALDQHPDDAIRRALAGALAVPASEIRRSRTALFLYLLKRHAEED